MKSDIQKGLSLLGTACLMLVASSAIAQEDLDPPKSDLGPSASGNESSGSGSMPSGGMALEGRRIGIGLGTSITGNDILEPNVASVRIVSSPRFVIEPFLLLSIAKHETDPEGSVTMSRSDSNTRLGIGATGRFFLANRSNLQLDLLGQARITHNTTSGDVLDTSTQQFNANWGLGVSWFFSENWGLSLDALNPVLTLSRVKEEEGASPGVESTWTFGVNWTPSVVAMLHLWM